MRRILAAVTVAGLTTVVAGAIALAPAQAATVSAPPSLSASPSTPEPGAIVVTGVVRPGVEGGCLLLVPDLSPTSSPYLLIGGDREVLVPGAHVRVVGVQENIISWCMQGLPLRVLEAQPLP